MEARGSAQWLKNGALVIAMAPNTVLARWGRGGRLEFVTWYVDEDGNTYSGHYFTDIKEAAIDYEERRQRP